MPRDPPSLAQRATVGLQSTEARSAKVEGGASSTPQLGKLVRSAWEYWIIRLRG
jgi:hypothetical protein